MARAASLFSIGRFKPAKGRSTFVIAEIGINHEGDVDVCAQMIRKAAWAGADAVKLQTIDSDENYVTGSESYRVFKGAELTMDETARMFDLARDLGIEMFTTAGDFATLEWVEQLAPCAHKISSGLLTHLPVIRQAARYGRPMLVSTGMAQPAEIDAAISAIRGEGNEQIALFQCTSRYPAPPESLNLAAMDWMRQEWGLPVGFSDHTVGHQAAFLSVGAGAVMIEKHFSLDISRPGFDHPISVDPEGLSVLVEQIRLAESMLGDADKKPGGEMDIVRRKNLRCLVARRPMKAGESFTADNLSIKRPMPDQRGLEPEHYERVLGAKVLQDLGLDQPVTEDCIGPAV